MPHLSKNWFIEGTFDFELKKYMLLAYLQQIDRHFGQNLLYPDWEELLLHQKNLVDFKQHKGSLQQAFPRKLSKADVQAAILTYEKLIADDEVMLEIERIVSFALGRMDTAVKSGNYLYSFVAGHLHIQPVGIVPLKPHYGYVALRNGARTTYVYQYVLSVFESPGDTCRSISIQYVDTFEQSLSITPETIKLNLLGKNQGLPNPAMYYVDSSLVFPLEQTLLPVARKCLAAYIAAA